MFENIFNKKAIAVILIFLLSLSTSCGNHKNQYQDTINDDTYQSSEELNDDLRLGEIPNHPLEPSIEKFVGERNCIDEDYNYLVLDIDKTGYFSMYDAAAGNPGIAGYISEKDGLIQYKITDLDEFDPPTIWSEMELNGSLEYTLDNETLTLSYSGKTLKFASESTP